MKKLTLVILAAALAACGKSEKMPDVQLETLGGAKSASLAACETSRCLTVILAPWCGVCHTAKPHLLALRDHLKSKSIPTRVVVSYAEPERLKAFAKDYGDETMLDPDGLAAPHQSALPLFIMTEEGGRINKRIYGLPSVPPGPAQPDVLAKSLSLE